MVAYAGILEERLIAWANDRYVEDWIKGIPWKIE